MPAAAPAMPRYMLPAPTTIAIWTPSSWTRAISAATARTRTGSVPYSSEPIRDSPESFRRIRLKAATRAETLLADGEPDETPDHDVLAGLGREVRAQLLDGLAVVLVAVDVRLLEQDDLLVPLAQLALRGLLAGLLGHVVELLGVDTHLGLLGLLGHLVDRDPLRRGRRRDVQRDVLGERDELLVGGHEVGVAVDLDEHPDLAVGVDVGLDRALAGLAAGELADLVAHLDADDLDGLVEVAVGLLQGGLAVHHPRAGPVAQGLDVLRGNGGGLSHRCGPPRRSGWSRRRSRPSPAAARCPPRRARRAATPG